MEEVPLSTCLTLDFTPLDYEILDEDLLTPFCLPSDLMTQPPSPLSDNVFDCTPEPEPRRTTLIDIIASKKRSLNQDIASNNPLPFAETLENMPTPSCRIITEPSTRPKTAVPTTTIQPQKKTRKIEPESNVHTVLPSQRFNQPQHNPQLTIVQQIINENIAQNQIEREEERRLENLELDQRIFKATPPARTLEQEQQIYNAASSVFTTTFPRSATITTRQSKKSTPLQLPIHIEEVQPHESTTTHQRSIGAERPQCRPL